MTQLAETSNPLHRHARLAGTLYGLYDKDTHIDRVFGMLDSLKACERTGRAEC